MVTQSHRPRLKLEKKPTHARQSIRISGPRFMVIGNLADQDLDDARDRKPRVLERRTRSLLSSLSSAQLKRRPHFNSSPTPLNLQLPHPHTLNSLSLVISTRSITDETRNRASHFGITISTAECLLRLNNHLAWNQITMNCLFPVQKELPQLQSTPPGHSTHL